MVLRASSAAAELSQRPWRKKDVSCCAAAYLAFEGERLTRDPFAAQQVLEVPLVDTGGCTVVVVCWSRCSFSRIIACETTASHLLQVPCAVYFAHVRPLGNLLLLTLDVGGIVGLLCYAPPSSVEATNTRHLLLYV